MGGHAVGASPTAIVALTMTALLKLELLPPPYAIPLMLLESDAGALSISSRPSRGLSLTTSGLSLSPLLPMSLGIINPSRFKTAGIMQQVKASASYNLTMPCPLHPEDTAVTLGHLST